jgi:hypothetical protein
MSDPVYEITLEDGRKILLEEQNETLAREAARRWARLNPPDGGEVGIYEVTVGDRTVRVPAVSEAAAIEFTQAWGPQQRALEDARARAATTPGQVRAITEGFTANLVRPLDAATAALETGVTNLAGDMGIGDGAGYGMSDAFNAVRVAEGERSEDFFNEEPVQSIGLNILGGYANPLLRRSGDFVASGAGRGLLASEGLLPAVGRGLGVGAGIGGVSGLAASNPGDEVGATVRGGIIGGALGGGVPLASGAATATARAVGLDQLPAVINRATGGRISALNGDVDRRNLQRLSEAMRADNISPDQIRTAMNDAMRYGISPNLLDIVGPNATRTRMLVVGAAQAHGPGMTAGTRYRDEVAGSVQDQAVDQAYRLTPGETRSAVQYRQGLDDTSEGLAATDYAGPYAERVPITNEIERALQGVPGEVEAARRASAYRFPERAAEIADLVDPNTFTGEVSGGALDRIQRRLGTAGRNARRSLENPDNEMGADLYARQSAINEALEAVPGLAPARATFRGYNVAGEGVDLGQAGIRQSAGSVRPADYIDQMGVLEQQAAEAAAIANRAIPTPRQGAQVGMRDQIVQDLGGMVEGGGVPSRYFNTNDSANVRRVMGATFDQPVVDDFQGALGMLNERMRIANFMDSSRGSPTAGRLSAVDALENQPRSVSGVVLSLIGKIRRGATLTDADREAIVRLGTTFGATPPTPATRGVPVSGRIAPILAGQGG